MLALYYEERRQAAADLKLLRLKLNGVMVTDKEIEHERQWQRVTSPF